MHNFRKLNIWIDAMALAKEVYLLTSKFPKDEKFGLVSQINRCSVSVPSNIAEGSSRSSKKEFSHFIKISLGSLFELETQLILANEVGFYDIEKLNALEPKIVKLQKMLCKFLINIEGVNTVEGTSSKE
jgi:four helix bundle protein